MTTRTIDQLPAYTGDPTSAYALVRYGGVSYKLLLSTLPSGSSYTHPATHPASIIEQDASNRFVTDAEKAVWDAKQPAGDYATGGGTATGSNTGDETTVTIKTKLGITTLSGSNTGDQTIPTTLPASDVYPWAKAASKPNYTADEVGLGDVPNLAFSGSNTGDETAATIKSKLGIATLSGSNTGDQAIPTSLPASDVYAWAKSATMPNTHFNNMGLPHPSHTDFNAITDFGFNFLQAETNGPGTGSSQFYTLSLGLGIDYPHSAYALQLAIARFTSDKYLSFRTREGGAWQPWVKASAGYADTAGTVASITSAQVTTALGYTPGNSGGLSVSVISGSTTATTGGTYVLTASLTLTLPASPAAGNTVAISNRSSVATCVVARNGQLIMGLAEDMTLDIAASITLVYADATRGWVIL